jgi:hypothetical protein
VRNKFLFIAVVIMLGVAGYALCIFSESNPRTLGSVLWWNLADGKMTSRHVLFSWNYGISSHHDKRMESLYSGHQSNSPDDWVEVSTIPITGNSRFVSVNIGKLHSLALQLGLMKTTQDLDENLTTNAIRAIQERKIDELKKIYAEAQDRYEERRSMPPK